MILLVIWRIERIRETRGQHTIPEVVPLQQIAYNAFAIQQVIAHTPKELQVQMLDLVIVLLLVLFTHILFLDRMLLCQARVSQHCTRVDNFCCVATPSITAYRSIRAETISF